MIIGKTIAALLLSLSLAACAADGSPGASGGKKSKAQSLDNVARSMIKAADMSRAAGDYETAIQLYQRLLQTNSENPDVVLGLSRSLRYSGKGVEARARPWRTAPV